jgi:endonuclease YncB( thermonuclease family)
MNARWAICLGSLAVWALAGHLRASGARKLIKPDMALIACPQPNHHDGDALRCGYHGRSMRLYAIDAPEMPGACRVGRWCVPGDPFASRDHLASLTAGHSVTYRVLTHDRYGRPVVQAFADGRDISCDMVRDGFAIERYGKLRCGGRNR